MQSGQVRVFPDSTRLDRCPHLAERPAPTCAICVPVNIAGSIRGVLHVERPAAGGIPERLEHGMMVIGRRLAERLGALQVLARTQYRAETDPLTGLSNRTTFETLKERLAGSDARYVVAFADLDHFKAVNDEYGHETGDRALRLFARVLRDAVRPEDLVARYGGEEFVVVLPECSISDARLVGKRIRDTLAKAVVDTGLPVFTVTIGLAAAEPGEAFAKVVSRADAAMLRGKQLGRNHLLAFEELAIPQDPDTSADPTAAEPLGSERAAPPAA